MELDAIEEDAYPERNYNERCATILTLLAEVRRLREAAAPVERLRVLVGWDRYGRTGSRVGPDFTPPGCVTWTPILWDDEEDPDWHKACGLVAIPHDAPSSSGAPPLRTAGDA